VAIGAKALRGDAQQGFAQGVIVGSDVDDLFCRERLLPADPDP